MVQDRIKVVIAPSAFKGSLTAVEVAESLGEGVRRVWPQVRIELLPVSRSLTRALRRSGWETTVDVDFAAVVSRCRVRPDDGTWITDEMAAAYARLHRLGWPTASRYGTEPSWRAASTA